MDMSGTVASGEGCAPYARQVTGIVLSGDAYQWWDRAEGRYARSSQPRVGAVLVLKRGWALSSGHVAVVRQILSAREILVDQANWEHNRISHDDPVWDVSAGHDWSLVRVWWRPSVSLGLTQYPAYGFVGPERVALNRSLQGSGSSAICAASMIALANPDQG